MPLQTCAKELAAFTARTATISNHDEQNLKKSQTMSQYNKLYTKEDSAIVFIDHQPQMLFGVEGINRASLINNVTLIAKAAKEFGVPAVLTAVENRRVQRIRLAATAGRVPRPRGGRAYLDELMG